MAVAAAVLRLWLRRPPGPEEARAAAAIAASYLLTPYVWGYDTPAIAVAALFLARAALRDGWLPGEKALLLTACLLPALLVVVQHPLVTPLVGCWCCGWPVARPRWRLAEAGTPSFSPAGP